MTIFVDASALVAIIRNESGSPELLNTLERYATRLISPIALWEAVRGVAKSAQGVADVDLAWSLCERYRTAFGITIVNVGAAETDEAIRAHGCYGKGNHPAKLNMGDCFAYACAKTNGAALLYKGDDFSQTDLA